MIGDWLMMIVMLIIAKLMVLVLMMMVMRGQWQTIPIVGWAALSIGIGNDDSNYCDWQILLLTGRVLFNWRL